jgi:hypothetical protein
MLLLPIDHKGFVVIADEKRIITLSGRTDTTYDIGSGLGGQHLFPYLDGLFGLFPVDHLYGKTGMDDDIFAYVGLDQGYVHLSGDTSEIDVCVLTLNA